MPVTLSHKIYEVYESKFGKEDAGELIEALEQAIEEAAEYKWAVTKEELISRLSTKEELRALRTEFKEEFATKKDLEIFKTELENKIETEILRLNRKFTIMFVILFFTIIFLNQNALEFLARILGLVK